MNGQLDIDEIKMKKRSKDVEKFFGVNSQQIISNIMK